MSCRPLALALTLAMVACGGGDTAETAPDSPAATADSAAAPDTSAPAGAEGSSTGPWSTPPLSGAGAGEGSGVAVLRQVRIARHDGYDRIVFEFEDHLPPWALRSVTNPAQCGSGNPVDAGGAVALEVDFRPAAAHTEAGQPTIAERTRRPGLPALRTARLTCDFEAIVAWVLGVDHRGEVRALELASPPRLAVDVRHR